MPAVSRGLPGLEISAVAHALLLYLGLCAGSSAAGRLSEASQAWVADRRKTFQGLMGSSAGIVRRQADMQRAIRAAADLSQEVQVRLSPAADHKPAASYITRIASERLIWCWPKPVLRIACPTAPPPSACNLLHALQEHVLDACKDLCCDLSHKPAKPSLVLYDAKSLMQSVALLKPKPCASAV